MLQENIIVDDYSEKIKGCTVLWIDKKHPARKNLEAFIYTNFFKAHQAKVDHFFDHLFACSDGVQFMASLGINFLRSKKKGFVEQYLDCPAEQAVAKVVQEPIARSEIVELGNLSSIMAGATRRIIFKISPKLIAKGAKWAVFTINKPVYNAFKKSGLNPIFITEADPSRLSNQNTDWGTYYQTKPCVYVVRIPQ
jgi:anti-anti-sigma regulatory factor